MNLRHLNGLALLLLAAPSAFAQDPPKPEAKPETKTEQKPEPAPEKKKTELPPDHPVIHVPVSADPNDPQQQIIKLFGEVEARLREIDKLLAEAAAGQRGAQDSAKPLEKAVSGIGELVKRSQDQGQKVLEGIDKILELAQQMENQEGQGGGSGKSGGKGSASGGKGEQQGPQDGKNPLEGARDTTTQRENTPDKPGSEQGKDPKGEKPDPSGSPKGNKKTEGDPKNTTGKTPPGSDSEKVARGPDARESWGYLPEHARDVFRTQGGGAMPARYREWIDAYYKKLNQKP